MGLYKENKTKLKFQLKNDNDIELAITCSPGARVNTNVNSNGVNIWNGEKKSIGNSSLKGKRVRLISITEDRTNQGIIITFTFTQKDGEILTYVFPDDFTGEPEFDTDDDMPTFYLYLNVE